MDQNIALTEEQREVTVMALAHLAVERSGWDSMLREIAAKIDNESWLRYDEFKKSHSAKIVDLDGGVAQSG